MIELMPDMPKGVLGFRATGEITRADYDDVLMPPIREAISNGVRVRAVCQIGPGFEGYDKDAAWDDVKAGREWGVGRHQGWECIAVVTDHRKLRKLAFVFGWMAPGELELFSLDQLAEAKSWAAGSGG